MTGFNVKQLITSSSDGHNFTLVEPFTFTCQDGTVIDVGAGAQSDGASVPQALWAILPPFGSYWMAAFLHDSLYRYSDLPKDRCDAIFAEALEWLKVGPALKDTLYEGVERLAAIPFAEDRADQLAALTNQPVKEMTMWSKIKAFFSGFFHNAASDPVNTAKGIVQIAAAAGTVYAISTGALPVQAGVPLASALAVSGLHAVGTDTTTGVTAPAEQKAIDTITAVSAAAPAALSLVDQVKVLKSQADAAQGDIQTAQGKILAYTQLATMVAAAMPAPPNAPPIPAAVAAAPAAAVAQPVPALSGQ